MKRRVFVIASLLSLSGLGGLCFLRWIRNPRESELFVEPRFLSLLCNKNTILMLGREYLKLKPEEKNDTTLLNYVLPTRPTKGHREKQDAAILESEIEQRIIQDFDTNNIVIVQGWVLSITEARQCAMYSIHNT